MGEKGEEEVDGNYEEDLTVPLGLLVGGLGGGLGLS